MVRSEGQPDWNVFFDVDHLLNTKAAQIQRGPYRMIHICSSLPISSAYLETAERHILVKAEPNERDRLPQSRDKSIHALNIKRIDARKAWSAKFISVCDV